MTLYTTRLTFDRHLKRLMDEVLILGSLVEQAVIKAVDALKRQDRNLARVIYQQDQVINERRYAIENECIILLATQQPMGRDVRYLAAIMEIITELERIGDYAKGISKINLMLEEVNYPEVMKDLQSMADMGLSMLRRALNAFTANDVETARSIAADDDQVDTLYNRVHKGLMQLMIKDPQQAETVSYLMWAAHNLERLADRVINICERIVYVNTGEVKELDTTEVLPGGAA